MTSARLWRIQNRFAPYFFISPFVILFCTFLLYPLARSFYLSLCRTVGPGNVQYTGLANYRYLIHDPYFWIAAGNTTIYVVVFLAIQIPASLGLAILLNSPNVKAKNFFRFAFYSTHLVGQVFVSVIFAQLLNPRSGLVTNLITHLTGHYVEMPWLNHPILARVSVLFAWLWLSIGYGMIYFLAALQNVDQHLYEAAEVDGAGTWSRFWHITLPSIRPVSVFLLLIGLVGGFQLFELPYVLLQGPGPGGAGITIVMYLFNYGFALGNLGYASTIGWALVLIILIISLLQIWLTKGTSDE